MIRFTNLRPRLEDEDLHHMTEEVVDIIDHYVSSPLIVNAQPAREAIRWPREPWRLL